MTARDLFWDYLRAPIGSVAEKRAGKEFERALAEPKRRERKRALDRARIARKRPVRPPRVYKTEEHKKAVKMAWMRAHPERCKEAAARWRAKNPNRWKTWDRKKRLAAHARWRAAHPGYWRKYYKKVRKK
jgi:hypothetical protein